MMMLNLNLLGASATAGECRTVADCTAPGLLKPACVVQSSGNWSQCIDCTATSFQDACVDWTAALRVPAEEACGIKCTGPPGPKLACHTNADCKPDAPTCVVQEDGYYAQCVSCKEPAFDLACVDWEKHKFLPAAEAKCDRKCTGVTPKPPAPKLVCRTDAECTDAKLPSCVVEADGAYAQCVSCKPTDFANECPYWNKTSFLPEAEAKCHQHCISADDCTGGTEAKCMAYYQTWAEKEIASGASPAITKAIMTVGEILCAKACPVEAAVAPPCTGGTLAKCVAYYKGWAKKEIASGASPAITKGLMYFGEALCEKSCPSQVIEAA